MSALKKIPKIQTIDVELNLRLPQSITVFWCEKSTEGYRLMVTSVAEVIEKFAFANNTRQACMEYVRRERLHDRDYMFAPIELRNAVYAYFVAGGIEATLVVLGTLDYLDEVLGDVENVSAVIPINMRSPQPALADVLESRLTMAIMDAPDQPTGSLDSDLQRWKWRPTNNIAPTWPKLMMLNPDGEGTLTVDSAPTLVGHWQKNEDKANQSVVGCVGFDRNVSNNEAQSLVAEGVSVAVQQAGRGYVIYEGKQRYDNAQPGEPIRVRRLDGTMIEGKIKRQALQQPDSFPIFEVYLYSTFTMGPAKPSFTIYAHKKNGIWKEFDYRR